jgi:thiamine biosynthesis lipoprotein
MAQTGMHIRPENFLARLQRFSHKAMATTFEISILDEEQEHASEACRAAFDLVDELEQQLSYFIPSSDIAQINRLSGGKPLRVGIAAFNCLAGAKAIHDETGGAFDVTAGALLTGRVPWDKDEENPRGGQIPRQKDGLLHVGMDAVLLDHSSFSVALLSDQVEVDLGGIGKGYAVDQIKQLLDDWGIERALVNAGQSTMYAVGTPPDRHGWPMRILDPENEKDVLARFYLKDAAVSASSPDEKQNLLDPRTGCPAGLWTGTWSVATTALEADALSTAFFILSEDEVRQYCQSHNEVGAVLIRSQADTPVMSHYGNWTRYRLKHIC